jgi:putative ATP-grasp target RiPP
MKRRGVRKFLFVVVLKETREFHMTALHDVASTPTAFVDDPLASISSQFSLCSADFATPSDGWSASAAATRPFGLRWLRDIGTPTAPTWYRYCPRRQVLVDATTDVPLGPSSGRDWTTTSHLDGDEGPSKDYGWETTTDSMT